MPDSSQLRTFLERAVVEESVFALRPDYRAVLVAADGLRPGPSDEVGERLLMKAESAAHAALVARPMEELPHVAAWRDAYRAFGAKPQRTRNSLEALLRRVDGGLPRVNRLTDIYNAISVSHQLPLGGEDLLHYDGPPRLTRAAGTEPFDTTAGGEPVTEHPDPGEVIWTDDSGVTCRRWNWRQGRRTRLRDTTTTALFILDVLDPTTDEAVQDAVADLSNQLERLGPNVQITSRVISAAAPSGLDG
jgi:DNA/RNA-binding domain of Phe-tRNA-synthetase-like protein